MRLRAHACAAILARARTRVRILAVYQLHAARVPRARRRQRGRACQFARQWWVVVVASRPHRATTTVVRRVFELCERSEVNGRSKEPPAVAGTMELHTPKRESRPSTESLDRSPSVCDTTFYPWNWGEEARNVNLSPGSSCSSPEYREQHVADAGGGSAGGRSATGNGCESHRRGRPRADALTNLMKQGSTSPSSIKCTYCSRVFPREKSLQAHLRTHTGKRDFFRAALFYLARAISRARGRAFRSPASSRASLVAAPSLPPIGHHAAL